MPTPTYTLIDSVTLAASAATVTFSSISAAGKGDLVLIVEASTSSASHIQFRLNGDSGSNYNLVNMYGNGSSAGSYASSNVSVGYFTTSATPTTGVKTIVNASFLDYSATDKHKSVISRAGKSASGVDALANRWASTAAVTSLQVIASAGSFQVGSTFHLYQLVSE